MKYSVLVVDDEPYIALLLKKKLEGIFFVQTCHDGLSALKLIDEVKFDCIITDLKMPGASGADIIDHMNKIGRKTPVYIVSGCSADDEILIKAKKAGVAGVLEKPLSDLNRLADMILEQILAQA